MEYFQHSLHPTIEMNMSIDPSYDYEGISEEDDVFFAEIRRQILLLTADDDGGGGGNYRENRIIHTDSACELPGSNGVVGNLSCSLHGSYFSSWESKNTNSVPTWLANLWRNGNGTGVFIPHIDKSIRHHRPGRRNKRKVYRTVQNKQKSHGGKPLPVEQVGICTS